MIRKGTRHANGETFSTTHVYLEASLMGGSFIECPITLELSPGAEDALAASRDEVEFVTRLLHFMKGEHAQAVERCDLSDSDGADSLRLLRDALGDTEPTAERVTPGRYWLNAARRDVRAGLVYPSCRDCVGALMQAHLPDILHWQELDQRHPLFAILEYALSDGDGDGGETTEGPLPAAVITPTPLRVAHLSRKAGGGD